MSSDKAKWKPNLNFPKTWRNLPFLDKKTFKESGAKVGDEIRLNGALVYWDGKKYVKFKRLNKLLRIYSIGNSVYVEDKYDDIDFSLVKSPKYYFNMAFYGTIEEVCHATLITTIEDHHVRIIGGKLVAGCQTLSPDKTLDIFRKMGEALGYKVEG